MNENNILKDKSFAFALRCVRLYNVLKEERQEFILSTQFLRSGTSIGANIKEAIYAQTKADFASKLSIAKKEAGETEYWLELMSAAEILRVKEADSMLADCRELLRMLIATTKKLYGNNPDI